MAESQEQRYQEQDESLNRSHPLENMRRTLKAARLHIQRRALITADLIQRAGRVHMEKLQQIKAESHFPLVKAEAAMNQRLFPVLATLLVAMNRTVLEEKLASSLQ